MISRPLPVSMWVARQFTSTTRPRADGVSSQSPSWNGCSNNRNSPEMTCPTEFCSARPSTMERDAEGGEQTADVGAPDVGQDDRQADGDQRESGDVQEDRRDAFAPATFRRPVEEGGIEPGQQQDQDDEAEDGGDDPHRGSVSRDLVRTDQQQQQRAQRQDVVAQQRRQAGSTALPRRTSAFRISVRAPSRSATRSLRPAPRRTKVRRTRRSHGWRPARRLDGLLGSVCGDHTGRGEIAEIAHHLVHPGRDVDTGLR